MIKPTLLASALALALTTTAGAQDRTELTVLLDWFVNPDHAPLIIAEQKGWFEEAGLNVTLIPPSDPSAPPRLVAAGQGDIAVSYQPNLYLQAAEGLPLTWVGTLIETPLNSLVVLEGGPIDTIADLKGKTVGFSVGGFEDVLLSRMLAEADLTLEDVDLVNVNFSLSPSLITGQVDAVIGAFRNFELNQLDIEERPGLAFYPEENGVPTYDELIYITHTDRAGDAAIAAFLDVSERGAVWMTNHPEEALALFIKAHPDLDNELNRRAFADTLPRFAKRVRALDEGRYARFAAFVEETGLVEDPLPPLGAYVSGLD
ncbi:MAG: ABC transporter substrate-binding protein [Pseudomonadota bacterium]